MPSPCSVCQASCDVQSYTKHSRSFQNIPSEMLHALLIRGLFNLIIQVKEGRGTGGEGNPGQIQHENMKFMKTERWLILDGHGSILHVGE